MDTPGLKLKKIRESLKLTYRDVEKASREIAARRGSDEFIIALSRLADIENKGTLPSIYRIYTLCAVYRLEYGLVSGWYGAPLEELAAESVHIPLRNTHAAQFREMPQFMAPHPVELEIDLNRTTFLSHVARRWGKLPLACLNGLDLSRYRYGFVGLDDWSMYPILQPGAFVAIDESRRKIASSGWTSELDRPIYFLEHREGFTCGWCTRLESGLLVQPHPASHVPPRLFASSEADVLGQVVAVAMPLDARLGKLSPPVDTGF